MPFRKRVPAVVDPLAPVVPPVPGSAASIPKRPKNPDIDLASKALRESLKEDANLICCAPGYGLGEGVETGNVKGDREPKWRIYAFVKDLSARGTIPVEHETFPVTLRAQPASLNAPVWGRKSNRS